MVDVGVTRKAREQIANLLYAGSIPVTYSKHVVEIQQCWLTKDVVVLYFIHELRNQPNVL